MSLRHFIFWLSAFYVYAFFSNPHLKFSLTRKNFERYSFVNDLLQKKYHAVPKVASRIWILVALLREAFLIFLRFHWIEKIFRTRRKDYTQIYKIITQKRFNSNNPYLVAGDHFSSFYPRNLGFFYSKALHPITSPNLSDYKNRLVCYLNSLDFGLEFYQNRELSTTIVPIFHTYFLPTNIYSKPADTLCSILLAFDYLINPKDQDFQTTDPEFNKLQQQGSSFATNLLQEFRYDLKQKLLRHLRFFDPKTGLIDAKYSLSGIRDGVFRSSSFYENVVTFKTISLALKLNLIDSNELQSFELPVNLKKKITQTFCQNGIIYNDLEQQENLLENLSADFLVASSLGFFDLKDSDDLKIWQLQIDFVLESGLVSDLGIQYSYHNPKRTAPVVRFFVKDYMGKTVWSHWSTELCYALIDLYKCTQNIKYLEKASIIQSTLHKKIEQYKGYPELYYPNGKIYKNLFYVSMLDTGWIVNYEFLRKSLQENDRV